MDVEQALLNTVIAFKLMSYSLDQLIRQSNILIEIVDELLKSIKKAQDKEYLSKTELDVLNETITRTLNVSKSFMENYNEFLTNQIDVEFEIDIEE